jgi:hypothetical protein
MLVPEAVDTAVIGALAPSVCKGRRTEDHQGQSLNMDVNAVAEARKTNSLLST